MFHPKQFTTWFTTKYKSLFPAPQKRIYDRIHDTILVELLDSKKPKYDRIHDNSKIAFPDPLKPVYDKIHGRYYREFKYRVIFRLRKYLSNLSLKKELEKVKFM